jgi:hypothetical protein
VPLQAAVPGLVPAAVPLQAAVPGLVPAAVPGLVPAAVPRGRRRTRTPTVSALATAGVTRSDNGHVRDASPDLGSAAQVVHEAELIAGRHRARHVAS